MSSSTALQQQLSKLDTPGPVQHYAIAAIFDAACQGRPGSSSQLSAPVEAAILQCLCLQDGQAAAVAAEKLVECIHKNKLDTNVAQSLLLTALAVASAASASPLAAALVSIWYFQLRNEADSSSTTTNFKNTNMPWKSHMLSKALVASPFAGTELISSICKILFKYSNKMEEDTRCILTSLTPFLRFVFLDAVVSHRYPQYAMNLHSSLVRTAIAFPKSQHAMLRLLCSFLPALPVQSSAQQVFAESCVADIMDLLEACETEPGTDIVNTLVESLVSLCNDISSYGGNIAPFITALASIFVYWPAVVVDASIAGDALPLQLTRLSVVVTNGESTLAVLSLLCSVLLHRNGNENRNDNGDDEALSLSLAAAVSVQLVPTLAFGQLKHVKEWTSRVLAAVDRYTTDDSERASASLLSMLWSTTSAARCWLHSLESELSLIETPSTNTSCSLFPPTATLLLSLVHHPEAAVATAAVEGVIAAVHAAPLFGITALPVLIHKLHTTVEKIIMLSSNGSGSGEKINKKLEYKEALATVLSTLYALPRLAVHPSTVAFTIRALQPLLAPPAPEFLQGVALRLLCEMWLTTGRGFPHLRTALLSYAAPSGGRRTAITPDMVENPVLRRAWAASLADVCDQDGERAQDLVHSITECLANQEKGAKPTAEVQAAGLECVAELCEADILDFYKAWKVVKPLVPTLPQHPLAAAAWLRFLASGGLDAAVYPEISRGILKALWAAACDVSLSQVVRNQACASLAAFDFVVLEENDLLSQEMWEYAALLKTSSIITNSTITNSISRSTNTTITSNSSRSCEELVVHVLGYEHATRRRQRSGKESTKLTTGKSTGRLPWSNRTRAAAAALGSDGGARGVQHKLVSTFPKALLGCGSRDPKEFIRRIPDISPIAVLLLWSPPPPSSSSSQQTAKKTTNATAVVAAKQAGAAYCSVFAELCKQSDAGFNGTMYTNNSQVLAAWASFLRRWTSAAKDAAAASAAAGVPTTPTPNEKTTAGAQAVWQVIKASLQSGNTTTSTSSVNVTVVSTAACAAAALASSVFPQPIKLIVEEVFEFLTQHAQYDLNGSIFIQAVSCTALGHCSDVARSILGLPAASAALEVLQRHVANADAPPAVRAASAIGLSLAVKQLSSKVNASLQNVGTLVKSLVLSLLAASRVDDAPVTSFLQQTDFYQEDSSKEVVDAVLIGLSDCLSIVLSVGLPTDLLCTLRTAATEMLLSATSPTLAVHGVCQLLKSSTLVGYKINSITATEVVETLNYLQQIAASGSAAFTSTSARNARSGGGGGQMQNGKLAGAAALALGSMIPSLIKEGFVFPSSTSSSHYLESIVLLAKNSSDSKVMSSRGSAKQGAAAGIASVLSGVVHQSGGGRMGEDVVVVVFNEMEKQAFDVLESLSLKDEDSRARRGCAHALAELCWSARHGGKKLQPLIEDSSTSTAATAESATTANLTKGIASLPDNSALRYLCETLESGTWPEVQDHHDNDDDVEKKETPVLLTSEQAASVLRCLASAHRLPVLDWSAACRRVLRSHPGSAAVQKGVVLLFSSHASVSQALQMYEFISEDIFGQPGFINWQPEAQYAVLKEMHQLLVALPDAEAASVLRMLCSDTVCPDVFSNSRVDKYAVEWQTALLQGLSATAAMKEDNINLGKIAWECAVHAVLPKLPVPCTWPLGLNLSTLQHYVEKEDTVNNNKIMAPWVQLLTCALTASKSSATVLDRLCSEEIPPDTFAKNHVHWTWLCAALVENNGVDLRGLQQPRNFILSGSNGGDSRGSIDKTMDIVLLLVSRAVGSCPTATIAQKQQWILDILHASANCAAPAAAVTLAVLATVAVASGSGGGNNSSESCFGKAHNVLIECETAVNALPSSLRYLAETIKPCPVTLVTAIVEALGGTAAANDDWKGKRELQKQCCWALRHALPSETWVELYTCVEGEE